MFYNLNAFEVCHGRYPYFFSNGMAAMWLHTLRVANVKHIFSISYLELSRSSKAVKTPGQLFYDWAVDIGLDEDKLAHFASLLSDGEDQQRTG